MERLTHWLLILLSTGSLLACASPIDRARSILLIQAEAEQAYSRNDCEQAMLLYRKLADRLEDKSQALLRLGNCLAREQRREESMAVYREALQYEPGFVKAWHNLAYLQAQALGQTVAEMSAQVDPTDPAATEVRLLSNRIQAAFQAEPNPLDPQGSLVNQ